MRMSALFLRTLREDPADADVDSHRLLLRAGTSAGSAAGIYALLPLGSRVLRKVSEIVREEMDRAGAQEILMPIVQPLELWERTGRKDLYGDLHVPAAPTARDGDYCLSPTAEEIVTTSSPRSTAPTATCRRTSTRSTGSTATRSGPAPACCAAASS